MRIFIINLTSRKNRGPGHSYLEAAQKAKEERRKLKEQRLRKKMRKAKKKVFHPALHQSKIFNCLPVHITTHVKLNSLQS